VKLKKAAAWTIAGTALPFLTYRMVDPYADCGAIEAWFRGAAGLAIGGVVVWALGEIEQPEAS
jgi:hypothetical protein